MLDRIDPPPSKYKCFEFTAKAASTVKGYVWAKDEYEAAMLIKEREYEEITDFNIEEIIEVENVEVEE